MVKEFRSAHKRIYDSVHGFIKFDESEKELIDSLAFQRLHYIHQLGATYLVFPGATHSRFEHSLGVMELSTKVYQRLCKNVRPDLFHFLPRSGSSKYIYWKKVLRLAALCHDLGHLPFSHVAEKEILKSGGHEKWTYRIIKSKMLEKVWEKIYANLDFTSSENVDDFINDILKIALGERALKKIDPCSSYQFDNWQTILSDIINGDFFGADRIDYLLRDSKFTGIVYGLFDYLQLIETLRILPKVDKEKDAFALGVDENGLESCEALLLARHFMHKRVYQNSTVRSYNFHLKRFMHQLYDDNFFNEISSFLSQNDSVVLNQLTLASKDKAHKGHEDAEKIIYRKDRFKAIALSDKITVQDLENFKKNYNIEKTKIDWEISEKKEEVDLSFPVVKNHLTIVRAKELSTLLSSIPSSTINWVYIAPEFEDSILKFLEKNIK